MRCPPFRTKLIEEEQAAADHDGRVGDVERGPLVGADVEKQKIGDAAGYGSVEEIAGGAAQDECEAPGKEILQVAGAPEHHAHPNHCSNRERHEENGAELEI